ncbi:unnamed protein product [Arabidopsis arenosa]|uniref:Transmembrane protein n=1 Tax=Arabidopsis arenosa TaxID=38785 RepID=A0A8S2B0S5_ARAAE|nr:unnamed protein product [Arabidopsis arenosa]
MYSSGGGSFFVLSRAVVCSGGGGVVLPLFSEASGRWLVCSAASLVVLGGSFFSIAMVTIWFSDLGSGGFVEVWEQLSHAMVVVLVASLDSGVASRSLLAFFLFSFGVVLVPSLHHGASVVRVAVRLAVGGFLWLRRVSSACGRTLVSVLSSVAAFLWLLARFPFLLTGGSMSVVFIKCISFRRCASCPSGVFLRRIEAALWSTWHC